MATSTKALAKKMDEGKKSQLTPNRWRTQIETAVTNRQINVSAWMKEGEQEKLLAGFLDAAARNPQIMACTNVSVKNALVKAAKTGLYGDKEGAYVPMKNKGVMELEFWPSYHGLKNTLFRIKFAKKVKAFVMYEGDDWRYDEVGDKLEIYSRARETDRGERVCAIAYVKDHTGEEHTHLVSAEQVERIKGRSKGGSSSYSPWGNGNPDDLDWMWKKTALIQLCKLLPTNNTALQDVLQANAEVDAPEFQKPKIVDFNTDEAVDAELTQSGSTSDNGVAEENLQPA